MESDRQEKGRRPKKAVEGQGLEEGCWEDGVERKETATAVTTLQRRRDYNCFVSKIYFFICKIVRGCLFVVDYGHGRNTGYVSSYLAP